MLHVLYTVIERALTNPNFRQEEEELPMAISITTMKYAVALTEYYKEQRSIFVEASSVIRKINTVASTSVTKIFQTNKLMDSIHLFKICLQTSDFTKQFK